MPEQTIIAFATTAEFRQWLARHHADHPGIWLKIAKKASGLAPYPSSLLGLTNNAA